MSHLEIPISVALALGGAVASVVGALWTKLSRVEKERDAWAKRWADEVKTTAPILRRLRRNVEASQGTPRSEPPDAWDDNTEVRSRMLSEDRRWIDSASVDSALRQYLESTPPRQRKP